MLGHSLKILLLLLYFFFFCFSQAASAEEKYNTNIRYLYVQPGQTLHNIVRRLYPQRKKEWSTLRSEIVKINPHAFVNSNESKMKAGVRLELPQRMVVRPEVRPPARRKQVGVVEKRRGRVIAIDEYKRSRDLNVGRPVFLGDKIVTGEDGYLRLKMIDKAILDLHCYSIMVIEDYAIKGKRRSIINLLQGSIHRVTGTIGKLTGDVYEMKTPIANVGVRGTEYALRVYQSKGCGGSVDADNGFYLEVIKGLVNVHNKAGKLLVAKGDMAYVPLPDKKPVEKKFNPAILHPVKKAVPTPSMVKDNSISIWWWLLGIVIIAVAI